jgi:hypothetical protein
MAPRSASFVNSNRAQFQATAVPEASAIGTPLDADGIVADGWFEPSKKEDSREKTALRQIGLD